MNSSVACMNREFKDLVGDFNRTNTKIEFQIQLKPFFWSLVFSLRLKVFNLISNKGIQRENKSKL